MMLLSLVVGFMLLFAGGEMVVRGAVALARRFEVSPMVIGLTIVGFGTSLPELLVSVNAALTGAPGIAVGNVIGSNLANMMLILGVAALVFPLAVNPGAVRRDSLFMAAFTAIFIIVALGGSADRYEGALMLAALVGYVVLSLWQDARVSNGASQLHREEADSMTGLPTRLWLMVLFVVGGLLSVVVGADHLVGGATALARDAGVPDEVIGLTLVAVGTSLPEVATAIVAAYRRHADICIGNVIGSNIFNLFGILGITALAAPVPFSDKIVGFDLWVLGAMTLLLVPLLLTGWRLGRREALLLLALYCVYILSQFQEWNDLTAPV
ncbi:MAG: calcium/sodium antiporter [bacterium]|nr:calcium/sodium antiporter [bacterium]